MNDVITLKSGIWEAGVCPSLGGNLISLTCDGKHVLRPLVDEAQIAINPYLQGAPILLPANRTYLGKFTFEGVEYSLPVNEASTNSHLHGLVHRQAFSVVKQSETSITMKYVNVAGPVYPFDFEMVVTYTVDEFVYTVSENFDHWITWNARGKEDYICLEPQAGKVNGLNIPDGHIVLAPEQSEVYTARFSRS